MSRDGNLTALANTVYLQRDAYICWIVCIYSQKRLLHRSYSVKVRSRSYAGYSSEEELTWGVLALKTKKLFEISEILKYRKKKSRNNRCCVLVQKDVVLATLPEVPQHHLSIFFHHNSRALTLWLSTVKMLADVSDNVSHQCGYSPFSYVLLKTCRRRTIYILRYNYQRVICKCIWHLILEDWNLMILLTSLTSVYCLGLVSLPECFAVNCSEENTWFRINVRLRFYVFLRGNQDDVAYDRICKARRYSLFMVLYWSELEFYISFFPETKNNILQEFRCLLTKKSYTLKVWSMNVALYQCVSSKKNNELDKKMLEWWNYF